MTAHFHTHVTTRCKITHNLAYYDICVLWKRLGFYIKLENNFHWKICLAWRSHRTRDAYDREHAAVWQYHEVARSARCPNLVSAVLQQPSEVFKRQFVPSDSQVHDEGVTVSQEQHHDGCTCREVHHATGHESGCAVVTCGCNTDISITSTTGNVLDRLKRLWPWQCGKRLFISGQTLRNRKGPVNTYVSISASVRHFYQQSRTRLLPVRGWYFVSIQYW
jgi:hypothetical protein